MSNSDKRPDLGGKPHPLKTKKYMFFTPAIENLCAEVAGWADANVKGGLCWAPPSTGKTFAISALKLELEADRPGVPVLFVPAWDDGVPTELQFIEYLLALMGKEIENRRSALRRRLALVEAIVDAAVESGHDSFILMMDEAQNLHPRQYNWLIGLHNLAQLRGVRMLTLLFGQHQLVEQRTAFLASKQNNIVSRFMVKVYRFKGILSCDELGKALACYDKEEFPEESGWSYTRYHAPQLFNLGWRLASVAKELWTVLQAISRPVDQSREGIRIEPVELKMEYFCSIVQYFLLGLAKFEVGNAEAMSKHLKKAVQQSGYAEGLELS